MKIDMSKKNIKIPIILTLIFLLFHSIFGNISFDAFFNLSALEIILAGILLSIIISFSFETLFHTVSMVKASFTEKIDYTGDIHKLHHLSIKIKGEGLLSLQSDIHKEENTFLRHSLILLNDYKKPETIREILEKDIEARRANLYKPYNVFKMIANVAPAFGLIGTLLGLIGLLASMDNPNLIMNNMASALVSTLYGGLIANFVAVPLMGRLKDFIDQTSLRYNIIMEGILLMAKNDSARNVFDKMNVMLREDQRLEYPRKEINERNLENYESR